jgi:hypothetical protein
MPIGSTAMMPGRRHSCMRSDRRSTLHASFRSRRQELVDIKPCGEARSVGELSDRSIAPGTVGNVPGQQQAFGIIDQEEQYRADDAQQ